jgi:hypothetical protein
MSFPWWPLQAAITILVLQTQSTPTEELACHQSAPSNQTFTRSLSNGAVLIIRRVDANSLGQACEAVVRDRNGKTIFEDRGFNTRIDPATGRDIDNDGQIDAVVGVDTLGGKTGNWEYPVISFAPSPRVILKLPHATYDFQTKPGKTLIWTAATFEDLNASAANTAVVATVHEFRPNGFIDVTSDYCKSLLSGELAGLGNLKAPLATLNRQAKLDSRTNEGRPEDREDTRVAAMTIVLQEIYCGQFEEASRLVLEVWPGSEQSRIRREIKSAVEDRWPDLAKRLAWD